MEERTLLKQSTQHNLAYPAGDNINYHARSRVWAWKSEMVHSINFEAEELIHRNGVVPKSYQDVPCQDPQKSRRQVGWSAFPTPFFWRALFPPPSPPPPIPTLHGMTATGWRKQMVGLPGKSFFFLPFPGSAVGWLLLLLKRVYLPSLFTPEERWKFSTTIFDERRSYHVV